MNLKPGSKCWVKMKGYPPWPARINVLPSDVKLPRGKLPIFFYGTHEISYAKAKDIFDFEKFRHKYCSYKGKSAKFNDALLEVDENPTIFQLGSDTRAIEFLSQFYKFNCEMLKSDEIEEKTMPHEPPTLSNRKRPLYKTKTPDINEPKRKLKKTENNEEKNANFQSVSNSNLQKADESAIQNLLLHVKEPILQTHIKNSSEESLLYNANINELDDNVHEPSEPDLVFNLKNESNSTLKKLSVANQIELNTIQPVLQPKNITGASVKKSVFSPVTETIKQATRESDSQIIQVEEETMEKILKKKNREISIVLNDVLTCTDILSVRSLTPSEDVNIRETENNNLLHNAEISPDTKSENVNIYSNSFKSPIKTTNNKRPIRASAQKFKQNFLTYLKDLNSFPKFTNKKPDITMRVKKETNKPKKSEKKTEEKNRIKTAEKSPANVSNRSVDYNHNASIPASLSKSIPYKDENELRIISKLSIIDKEIKKSLIVGQEKHEICRKMMANLLDLNNLTLISLCQVPEIIVTIRKCRRYKKDDSIKSSACKIFQIFSQLYDQSELEEKVSAGTELLKRHPGECKTAQVLFNELFVIEKRQSTQKTNVPSLVLSSPSSAQSFHSSANNTPLLINDTPTDTQELGLTLDPDLTDINKLLRNGILVLIDSYSCDESETKKNLKTPFEKRSYSEEIDLYKQLGV